MNAALCVAADLIPPGSALFHGVLAVHIPTALVCVICGAGAALSRKRSGWHPRLGTIYYWSVAIVFASSARWW